MSRADKLDDRIGKAPGGLCVAPLKQGRPKAAAGGIDFLLPLAVELGTGGQGFSNSVPAPEDRQRENPQTDRQLNIGVADQISGGDPAPGQQPQPRPRRLRTRRPRAPCHFLAGAQLLRISGEPGS